MQFTWNAYRIEPVGCGQFAAAGRDEELMIYGFEVEAVQAKKGTLPREERNDITAYITTVRVEAEDGKKAFRKLTNRVNGRLSRDCTDRAATITLPDYGNCQLMVRLRCEG